MLIDEIGRIFNSRDFAASKKSVPKPVYKLILQCRHRLIMLLGTVQRWNLLDKQLRDIADIITVCHSYFHHDRARSAAPNSLLFLPEILAQSSRPLEALFLFPVRNEPTSRTTEPKRATQCQALSGSPLPLPLEKKGERLVKPKTPGDIVCSELSASRLKFPAFLPPKARFSPETQNYITQTGKSDIGSVIFS